MNFKQKANDLKKQLKILGVSKGDTLLVRADLSALGRLSRDRLDYVKFLVDAVGEEGTIVGLAFTNGSFFKKNIKNIFDGTNKANTGAFANIMLLYPKAVRSKHPTNSYVAIGKNARYILEGHDETSGAYDPVKRIIELNGKMLLIGCAESSPGFTTTHLAEIDLELHKKIILPKLNNCYFNDEKGNVSLFRRKDIGGCSSTFYKFYAYYVKKGVLTQGYVGKAYSILVDAQSAYDIDRAVLEKNPKIIVCKDPNCSLCRARRWDNLVDIPGFFIRKLIKKIRDKLG